MTEKHGLSERTKWILLILLKSAIVFAMIVFTVVEPTFLPWIFFAPVFGLGAVGIIVPIVILLAVIFILSKIPRKSDRGEGFFKRHILEPLLIIAGTAVIYLLFLVGTELFDIGKTFKVKNDIRKAEVIYQYELSTFYCGGIMDINTEHDLIIVDYDNKKVSFLKGYLGGEYHSYKLKKGNASNTANIQNEIDLPLPGETLVTYYPDEENKHRTNAIELYMEDGVVYSVSDMCDADTGYTEYLGLGSWEEIVHVEKEQILG